MRAGIPLSAAAHVAVLALALWGLPWLRVRPEPPPPAVEVSLIDEAAFAPLSRGRPTPAPPEPEAVPEAVPDPAPAPRAEPAAEPETDDAELEPDEAELESFAPDFNPDSPLGIPVLTPPPAVLPEPPEPTSILARAAPPPPRPADLQPAPAPTPAPAPAGDAGAAAATSVGGGAEVGGSSRRFDSYQAAVRAAIARARVYPKAAQDRGLVGTARLNFVVAREGRLIEVSLSASSGSAILDHAALDAVNNAVLPAAPAELRGASFRFQQDLAFALN